MVIVSCEYIKNDDLDKCPSKRSPDPSDRSAYVQVRIGHYRCAPCLEESWTFLEEPARQDVLIDLLNRMWMSNMLFQAIISSLTSKEIMKGPEVVGMIKDRYPSIKDEIWEDFFSMNRALEQIGMKLSIEHEFDNFKTRLLELEGEQTGFPPPKLGAEETEELKAKGNAIALKLSNMKPPRDNSEDVKPLEEDGWPEDSCCDIRDRV